MNFLQKGEIEIEKYKLKIKLKNKIKILIKSTKYYQFHKKNIDFLCKKFCLNNISNIIHLYKLKNQNNDFFFFGESAYSRNKERNEEFRITFGNLPNKLFGEQIRMLNKLNYKIENNLIKIILNYVNNNKEKTYNLGVAFQENSFSGLKLYFNCNLQDIDKYFPEFYNKLIGKQTIKINVESICLLGINLYKNGEIKDYKLYSNFNFMKEEMLKNVNTKYHNIINDNNNHFIFKYFIRIDNKGEKSYKINSINFDNKNLMKEYYNYYPEKNNLKNVKIIGLGFGKENYIINKVDKYLLF